MTHFEKTAWLLSALVLLYGCGGGGRPLVRPSQGLNISGNWQFSTTSTVSGMPSMAIAGSIVESFNDGSVIATMHVKGSTCFDPLTNVFLSGTVTGSHVSLTSTTLSGQSITVTGNLSGSVYLNGTYTINGGCASGDRGTVSGLAVPEIQTSPFTGTFTASGGTTFDIVANVAQKHISSPEGSFGLSGTLTSSAPCFSAGTITPGAFPSGSFILGTSIALEIGTSNGTIAFLGMLDQSGDIVGSYAISGGSCDQSGTAVMTFPNPWGY